MTAWAGRALTSGRGSTVGAIAGKCMCAGHTMLKVLVVSLIYSATAAFFDPHVLRVARPQASLHPAFAFTPPLVKVSLHLAIGGGCGNLWRPRRPHAKGDPHAVRQRTGEGGCGRLVAGGGGETHCYKSYGLWMVGNCLPPLLQRRHIAAAGTHRVRCGHSPDHS